MLLARRLAVGLLALIALGGPSPASAEPPPAPAPRWCAPELSALSGEVCYALPGSKHPSPTELVVFLHGVIQPGQSWQWAQQRAAARAAAVNGVAALMPRGRRGLRTDRMKDWWTWPTRAMARSQVEDQVIEQWWTAKRELEAKLGRPFEKIYVFGFSNGAYYVSSLALRGRLAVDGYASFAGGIAPSPIAPKAYAEVRRVPWYVGYGHRDGPAKRDARSLRRAFRALRWPGKVVGRPKVGHAMTDAQVREALSLIRKTAKAPR